MTSFTVMGGMQTACTHPPGTLSEGHAFSRAVNGLCFFPASAPEVSRGPKLKHPLGDRRPILFSYLEQWSAMTETVRGDQLEAMRRRKLFSHLHGKQTITIAMNNDDRHPNLGETIKRIPHIGDAPCQPARKPYLQASFPKRGKPTAQEQPSRHFCKIADTSCGNTRPERIPQHKHWRIRFHPQQ